MFVVTIYTYKEIWNAMYIFLLNCVYVYLQDHTSKAVSVIIVGCQTKSIGSHLKKLLIAKVEKMCEENPQLCHINTTVRFVSNANLKKDILELRHHLFDVASTVKLSFGKTLYNTFICISAIWYVQFSLALYIKI